MKDRHIRVNVISPGTIDTGIFEGVSREVKDQFVSIIPMGRIGQSHENATAALFLTSDDASFITGIELFVDGGTAQIWEARASCASDQINETAFRGSCILEGRRELDVGDERHGTRYSSRAEEKQRADRGFL